MVWSRKKIFFQGIGEKIGPPKSWWEKVWIQTGDISKTFIDFICESPTSIEALGQDEENEVRPNGMVQKEEVEVEEPQIFKGGVKEDEKPWWVKVKNKNKWKPL